MTFPASPRLSRLAGAILLAAGFSFTVANPAAAQQASAADIALGKSVWMSSAPCKDCHGWGAHGVADVPQEPTGFNLRKTILTPEQMSEVIRCGRPQSEMPYFLSASWRADTNTCYGMTRAQVGAAVPTASPSTLSQRQIDALVAYIFADFVGKPQPTFEECQATLGAASTRCGQYPKQGAP